MLRLVGTLGGAGPVGMVSEQPDRAATKARVRHRAIGISEYRDIGESGLSGNRDIGIAAHPVIGKSACLGHDHHMTPGTLARSGAQPPHLTYRAGLPWPSTW